MSYRSIYTITYARKVKSLPAGRPRWLRLHGKRVKVLLEPDRRKLKVLEAPPEVLRMLKQAERIEIRGGKRITLREAESKPKPSAQKPQAKSRPNSKPEAAPEKEPIALREHPLEEALESRSPPKLGVKIETVRPKPLSEEDVRKAMALPVPDKGPIPTLIDWDAVPPEACPPVTKPYRDRPIPGAPQGLLKVLREMFSRNRTDSLKGFPVNVWIQGPPGTGKTHAVQKFAEEAGLPYWYVPGKDLTVERLLGTETLRGGEHVFIEGIIPRATRIGGVLHIDEANWMDPNVLARLNELLDHRRQLVMEETGETIKAHPDLFIVVTTNPNVEGVKQMPESFVNRLTKVFILDYPKPHEEMQALAETIRSLNGFTPDEFTPPSRPDEPPKGKYAKDIHDFIKVINGLRREEEFAQYLSMRNVQGFVQDLKHGDDFFTAFDRNVTNLFPDPTMRAKIEEALQSVGRIRPRAEANAL